MIPGVRRTGSRFSVEDGTVSAEAANMAARLRLATVAEDGF